ncbi:MAG: hypothetical protein JXR46_06680 [Calditrichaceae bacterium]|nr:hypothetical protein [Calditrichaceae bacterium]
MNNILRLSYTFIFIALFFPDADNLFSQTYIPPNPWQVDTLITSQTGIYRYVFPETHLPLMQTVQITKNGVYLRENFDYRSGDDKYIRFFSALIPGDTLHITYRRLPGNFKSKYTLFAKDTANVQVDTAAVDTGLVRVRRIQFENPFANVQSGLNTSGSIMRGVRVGTNSDFSLNSGLNLELSGNLTENLEVVAALNDEVTPIQPEGNTQSLNEIDKVFVNFRSPYVSGTVGDFNLVYENSQYGNVQRKLQGLTILGEYDSKFAGATVATTRGYYHHVSFIGQEGNQGPYQLTGKNGERDIIVLAGTERIYINGQLMTRGESNDYVIEYGNGQVIFSNRRLITSESRIEIDFEYFPSIQKYNRNVYGAVLGGDLFKNKLKVDMRFYRESDDPDQVLEDGAALTEQEKQILREAGNDPFKASVSGEIFRSDTSGSYVKIDTLINEQTVTIYRYTGRDGGTYDVRFSYVGPGNGDYKRDRLGVYRWAGVNRGEYQPLRLLPLPIKHETADFQLTWNPYQRISISGEAATSFLDQNVFSPLDDENNRGQAYKAEAKADQLPLKIKSVDLGKLTLNVTTKYVEKNFQPADRVFEPDYKRYWNILQEAEESNEEKSFQFSGIYQPFSVMKLTVNTGQLSRGEMRSMRNYGQLEFSRSDWFAVRSYYEFVGSDIKIGQISNDWWRYGINLQKEIWKLRPELDYSSELRKNNSRGAISGFQFDDYMTGLELINLDKFNGSVKYNLRQDAVYDYRNPGVLMPQSVTRTGQLELSIRDYANTSASLRIVRREKEFDDDFKNIRQDSLTLQYVDPTFQDTVWQDRTTNLAELNVSHASLKKALDVNVNYRISTEQTALREKIYIDVGENRGNYRYDEELDEYVPDANGNYVLFIIQSGRFEPVTNFQASFRVNIEPGRYWKKPKDEFQKLLTFLSSETFFRVEEETKERNLWAVYLMNLSKFQGDSTLRGNLQLNQDLYIMRRNRDLSFRLRYRLNTSRNNQYLDANDNEDRRTDEFGIRADWKLISEIRCQTEARRKDTFRENPSENSRNRNIVGWYGEQKFSYRPGSRWEIGLESEYGNENNTTASYPLQLWYGVLRGRLSYAIPGRGRITGDYNYQTAQLIENTLNLPIPYEMALGRKKGESKDWQLRGEYTLAKNILFTLLFTGRDEAGFKRVIHSGQAEIRAFF